MPAGAVGNGLPVGNGASPVGAGKGAVGPPVGAVTEPVGGLGISVGTLVGTSGAPVLVGRLGESVGNSVGTLVAGSVAGGVSFGSRRLKDGRADNSLSSCLFFRARFLIAGAAMGASW